MLAHQVAALGDPALAHGIGEIARVGEQFGRVGQAQTADRSSGLGGRQVQVATGPANRELARSGPPGRPGVIQPLRRLVEGAKSRSSVEHVG